jgi:hypothetical protein
MSQSGQDNQLFQGITVSWKGNTNDCRVEKAVSASLSPLAPGGTGRGVTAFLE